MYYRRSKTKCVFHAGLCWSLSFTSSQSYFSRWRSEFKARQPRISCRECLQNQWMFEVCMKTASTDATSGNNLWAKYIWDYLNFGEPQISANNLKEKIISCENQQLQADWSIFHHFCKTATNSQVKTSNVQYQLYFWFKQFKNLCSGLI